MSLEFRTLVAVQKETLLHSQLLRKVEELSEEHLQAYDAMKQEQHDKILKVIETCFVLDVLNFCWYNINDRGISK